MTLGEKLRQARLSRGMSQYRLSDITGLSQPAISYIENDKNIPTLQTVEIITKALGVSLSIVKGTDYDIKESLAELVSKYGLCIETPMGSFSIKPGTNAEVEVGSAGVKIKVEG